ncbi:MAG: MBL fold metallo-hydrolase [Verrucomicrobiota bacterium]
MALALEDEWVDVLNKAITGPNRDPGLLSRQSGVPETEIKRLCAGKLQVRHLEALAPKLGLRPAPLLDLAQDRYHPEVAPPEEGFLAHTTPFGDMDVNAYLIWDPASKRGLIFDTGGNAKTMLDRVRQEGITVQGVFLTHAHGDHIFDLPAVLKATKAPAWIGEGEEIPEARPFSAGHAFDLAGFHIETRLTRGHSPYGITYVIHGHPCGHAIAVVGDALFAGSMGGGRVDYADALKTTRERILSLPGDTLLCPGHGPLTTVALEKKHNPFF